LIVSDTPEDQAVGLSSRQRQILALLSEGRSNKEIGATLGITEGTVKQHLFTLYKKIGVTNRTKAVLKAEQLLALGPNEPGGDSSSALADQRSSNPGLNPDRYAWRMVTVLAVAPKTRKGADALATIELKEGLQKFLHEVQLLVGLFNGNTLIAPGGTAYGVFGAPKSHIDDAARAVFIATKLSEWLTKHEDIHAGIGIASTATLVGFGNEPLYQSDAFDLAQELAASAASGQILITEPTCQAAGRTFSYQAFEVPDLSRRFSVKEVLRSNTMSLAMLAHTFPAPYFDQAIQQSSEREAQWISVEGWPPSSVAQLMDVLSAHTEMAGLKTYRLRLSTEANPEKTAANIFQQLKIIARLRERPEGNESFFTAKSNAMSATEALTLLCMRGATAIFIYGIDSVDIVKLALGDHGIQAVSKLPLIFVCSAKAFELSPHLTLRMQKGSDDFEFSGQRIELDHTETPQAQDDLNCDLITMLDSLSPNTRQVLKKFIESGNHKIQGGNQYYPKEISKELLVSGLFVQNGGELLFRNDAVQNALKHFYKHSLYKTLTDIE
jgi:DNA-binding CsgD family transcriptional regulator